MIYHLSLIASLASAVLVDGLVDGPWSNVNDTPSNRAKALVANMTQAEKLSMLHGPPTGKRL